MISVRNRVNQGIINHVALVLDGSGSMESHKHEVIKVVDNLIGWLAQRSKDLDQETRVTVYVFDDQIECVIFDKDVLRLPSIKNLYWVRNATALIDATYQSQLDLATTSQLYGDHAYLTFVVTDGHENQSTRYVDQPTRAWERIDRGRQLRTLLAGQDDKWTLACLVPNSRSKLDVEAFGFPRGNIEIWDTSSRQGAEEFAAKMQTGLDNYMTARSTGTRSTTTLFANNVTAQQVQASGMQAVDPSTFTIVPVALASTSQLAYVIPKKSVTRKAPQGIKHVEIQPFIQETGRTYVTGMAYYELVKSERFEPNKKVALIHRTTKKVYTGDQAKALIGLTGTSTRVRPQPVKGGEYDIFIQSTSLNRHLPLGTRVLLFH